MSSHMSPSTNVLGYLETMNNEEFVWRDPLNGHTQNKSGFPIARHSILKIGRNERECKVIAKDPSVSSVHCSVWAVLFDEESVPMCYIRDNSLNGTLLNGKLLKRDIAYLISDGDTIQLCHDNNKTLRFTSRFSRQVNQNLLEQLDFQEYVGNWRITPRVIGNGTFGHVLVCYRESSKTGVDEKSQRILKNQSLVKIAAENFAVKIIKMKPKNLDKEAMILLKLDHPNIIKIHHTFTDFHDNLYIFQDLIAGGDLFSYLAKGDCLTSLSETESLLIAFQILQALKYLHKNDIVHRDLKLDNILLCAPEPCTRILLADFGIAKDLSSSKTRMHTVVGTPEYCAPEVGFKANRKAYQSFSRAATLEQKGYDNKCDLWSLGVIAHIILTGISPFYGDGSERSIIQNAKVGKLNFKVKQWELVSTSAKDFVKKLLEVDVAKRLDSEQSLEHPWIGKHRTQLEKIYSKKLIKTLEPSTDIIDEIYPNDKVSDWKRKLPKSLNIPCLSPLKKKQKKHLIPL